MNEDPLVIASREAFVEGVSTLAEELRIPLAFILFADSAVQAFHYRSIAHPKNKRAANKLCDLIIEFCEREKVIDQCSKANKPEENEPDKQGD